MMFCSWDGHYTDYRRCRQSTSIIVVLLASSIADYTDAYGISNNDRAIRKRPPIFTDKRTNDYYKPLQHSKPNMET